MLAIRLPEQVEKRLAVLASSTGRTKSYYVREALIKYLDEMEDIYLAESVLERVRKGEEKIYTSDEMEKLLALDN